MLSRFQQELNTTAHKQNCFSSNLTSQQLHTVKIFQKLSLAYDDLQYIFNLPLFSIVDYHLELLVYALENF